MHICLVAASILGVSGRPCPDGTLAGEVSLCEDDSVKQNAPFSLLGLLFVNYARAKITNAALNRAEKRGVNLRHARG